MAVQSTTRRVALVGEYGVGYSSELVQGIFDFVEHARHWQLRGSISDPFVRPNEIKPGVFDGLFGHFDSLEECQFLLDAGIPTINLSRFGERVPLPRVSFDDPLIGQVAAEYLLSLSFIHFGFFGWPNALHTEQRLERFRRVIERDAKLTCHVMDQPYRDEEHRRELLDRWLAQCPRPIAIFASGNYLAMVLAERVGAAGLSIPDDVAILGVGIERWAMPISPYRLSSVITDDRRQGYLAAQTLDRMMDGEPPPPVQSVAPLGVTSRASTDVTMSQDPMIRKALAYIRDHAAQSITVEDVLDAIGVSRSTLSNRMKRATGQTVYQVICKARVEQVKRLLLDSDQTIEQIAHACGFTAQPRLNEVFQRVTGMTPNEYRRRRHASGPRTP
jgi:LacI family transcriptional regulator